MKRQPPPVPKGKPEQYHLHSDEPEKEQFQIHSLKEYLSRNFLKATVPHSHSYYQLVWFKKGKGYHFVDFARYPVKEGSLFLISKNQIHHFENRRDCYGEILQFKEDFLLQESSDIDLILKNNTFNNHLFEPYMEIPRSARPFLNMLISQMSTEINANKPGRKELLQYLLKSFLILVERIYNESNGSKENLKTVSSKHVQFAKFRQLVEENYRKGMSVKEFARSLSMTVKGLNALTQAVAQKSPSILINERISLEAGRLLSHSSMNMREISSELGFEDPSYFSKFFKKATKLSPNEFRRLNS